MENIFSEPILKLPMADIPLEGCIAFLSQSETHQILFMQFDEDTILPEHVHAAQIGFVLEGRIDLTIEGQQHTYGKGDRYYIPAGVRHSGKIYKGYADITFFNESERYKSQ